jgi:CHAT domain-containing protein
VAFAALPVAAAGGGMEPLGARYAIRYAPSLTRLRVVSGDGVAVSPGGERRKHAPVPAALVVGNPVMPRVTAERGRTVRLPPLPAAARESRWVATALGALALTGAAATERTVRARMARAPVIHWATHGFASSEDAKPLDSFAGARARIGWRSGVQRVAYGR